MKKQVMTIAAIAIGAIAFTGTTAIANAGVMSPGLLNTAEFVEGSVEVTKVRGGHHRGNRWGGHRRHRWGGHRGHGRWGHGRWRGRWGHGRRHRHSIRHNAYGYGFGRAMKRYRRCLRLQDQGYRIRCNRPI